MYNPSNKGVRIRLKTLDTLLARAKLYLHSQVSEYLRIYVYYMYLHMHVGKKNPVFQKFKQRVKFSKTIKYKLILVPVLKTG